MNAEDYIKIPDSPAYYNLRHFTIPRHYSDDVESLMLPHGIIIDRVERLAQLIVADYQKRHTKKDHPAKKSHHAPSGLVLICILKGGHQFFADLLNAIKRLNQINSTTSIPIALEFIKIKSYLNDQSSGNVQIELTANETWDDVAQRFKGKDLLVVEDIVDTGRTMTALLSKLDQMEEKPAHVAVTSLFLKRTPLSNGYVPDYVGFSIPDKFIVGYCLDYNEFFRDLDHVCVISDVGKSKYSQ